MAGETFWDTWRRGENVRVRASGDGWAEDDLIQFATDLLHMAEQLRKARHRREEKNK